MIAFLLILILVFVAVDLFVRFIVDPMIVASKKKNKTSKSFTPKFDPSFKLATVTMYDGGRPHDEKKTSGPAKNEDTSKDEIENSKTI